MSCTCVTTGEHCEERVEMTRRLEQATERNAQFADGESAAAVELAERRLRAHLEQVKSALFWEMNHAADEFLEAEGAYAKSSRHKTWREAYRRYKKASDEFKALNPLRPGGHMRRRLEENRAAAVGTERKPPPGSESGTGA